MNKIDVHNKIVLYNRYYNSKDRPARQRECAFEAIEKAFRM